MIAETDHVVRSPDSLTAADLREFLALLPALYRIGDLHAFRRNVFDAAKRLVPADSYAYDELVPAENRALCLGSPQECLPASKVPLFTQYLSTHPVLQRWRTHGPTTAIAISDLVPRAELDQVPVYAELYREAGVEDQLGLLIDFPKPMMVALACNRGRRNFSQRDKDLLDLLNPHLQRAYENAVLFSQAMIPSADSAPDPSAPPAIRVADPPTIQSISPAASQLLRDFFPGWARRSRLLPAELAGWLRAQISALRQRPAGDELQPQLIIRRPGRSLILRLLLDHDGAFLIFPRLAAPRMSESAFRLPPLTPRQRELLPHLLQGLSAKQIAARMTLSIHTVNDHLKDIYARFQVSSRGELMAAFVNPLEATRSPA